VCEPVEDCVAVSLAVLLEDCEGELVPEPLAVPDCDGERLALWLGEKLGVELGEAVWDWVAVDPCESVVR
jgi:hypothetical protein